MHFTASAPTRAISQTSSRQNDEGAESHLVKCPSASWAFWRQMVLRAAGFPAKMVYELAAPEAALSADAVLETEIQVQNYQLQAVTALQKELDQTTEARARRKLHRAILRTKKNNFPQIAVHTQPAIESLKKLGEVHDELKQRMELFQQRFESESRGICCKVREIAGSQKFRIAVLLQNRAVVHEAVDYLASKRPLVRDKHWRSAEKLLASYWQRYCVKNDTVGFFGPVGWATFCTQTEGVSLRTGPGLVAQSAIYLEYWAVQALVTEIAKIENFRMWVAPRLLPNCHLQNKVLTRNEQPVLLSRSERELVQACDGIRTGKDLAAMFSNRTDLGYRSSEAVCAALESLDAKGILSWDLQLPIDPKAMARLKQFLNAIEEESVSQPALELFNRIEAACEEIQNSLSDSMDLDSALGKLDDAFTGITGISPRRSAGEMYAGRTLAYLECRRDVDMVFGKDIAQMLMPPLSLLLSSARWFTFHTVQLYRELFLQVYEEVANKKRGVLGLATFWGEARKRIEGSRPFEKVVLMLQDRWNEILQVPFERHSIEYRSEVLQSVVEAAFHAPHAGCNSLRYNSPDVMIAAQDVDALKRGDYEFVLGEFHLGKNTIGAACLVSQHPNQQELIQAMNADTIRPCIKPVVPRTWYRLTARTANGLLCPGDYGLQMTGDSPSSLDPAHLLGIGSFVVERQGDDVIISLRDQSLRFEIMEFAGYLLANEIINSFKMFPRLPHLPRIAVDKLIISRESWSFPAQELAFANCDTEAGRYLETRRWARNHGLPRHVFIKAPIEEKPIFVDFEAPVFIEILAKVIKKTQIATSTDTFITFTEMLPRTDQLWLCDAAGDRYTSELRMVAFDLNHPETYLYDKTMNIYS